MYGGVTIQKRERKSSQWAITQVKPQLRNRGSKISHQLGPLAQKSYQQLVAASMRQTFKSQNS